jgi:ubiquinol-cytochrome c reductase cytochrome c1 subunit
MPHVLWQLQGQRALVHQEVMRDGKPVSDGHGGTVKTIKWEQVTPGAMSQLEYDRTIRDLVNFMAWAAEPHQLERRRIGVWVLFGTTVLIFLTYFLYKAFWKNVH